MTRSTVRANPAAVNGGARSEVNTKGDLGSLAHAAANAVPAASDRVSAASDAVSAHSGRVSAATVDEFPEHRVPTADAVPADSAGLPAVPRHGNPAVLLM